MKLFFFVLMIFFGTGILVWQAREGNFFGLQVPETAVSPTPPVPAVPDAVDSARPKPTAKPGPRKPAVVRQMADALEAAPAAPVVSETKNTLFEAALLQDWTAFYRAEGAGMHLLNAESVLRVSKGSFEMTTTAETTGLLSFFVPAETVFQTEGKIKKTGLVPTFSKQTSRSGRDRKERQIRLTGKTLDYQTALLTLLAQETPASRVFFISDGRRTLEAAFQFEGIVNQTQAPFLAVEAAHYTLTLKILAGKKGGWFFNRMGDEENPPLHLYISRHLETGARVLSAVEFQTALFGRIRILLTHLHATEKTHG